MQDYSETLASTIENYLTSDGWAYDFDESHGIFYAGVSLQSKFSHCSFLIDVNKRFYQIYARLSADLTSDQMSRMALALNRINCEITFGHFEFSENGSLRYRLVIPVQNLLDERTLHNSLYLPAYLIDRYADELLSVLHTGKNVC